MIAALQKAQEIYGYLPEPVQHIIAEELGTSAAEVYGVATFYAQFSLFPKGQYEDRRLPRHGVLRQGSGDVYKKLCDTLHIEGASVRTTSNFRWMRPAASAAAALRPS